MVIIAYEGKTDEEFLNSLLDAYQLQKATYYNFEGKDNILNISHPYYDELEINIKKIEKILIIVDADNEKDINPNRGYEKSQEALKNLIKNLEFDVEITYHIMCDENKQGHLESFLLSVLDDEQKECIENFKKCYKYELTDKWVCNTFYKHQNHLFDYNHQNFNELKQKLQNLFN